MKGKVVVDISRRQFLRGDFTNRRLALRPPWAVDEQLFLQRCYQCGDCVAACPTHLIEPGDGDYPRVNFEHGECCFCGDCAKACTRGALRYSTQAPWSLTARVNDACLARHGVVCEVCGEQCAAHAITFSRSANAVPAPLLNPAACNGCGACVAPCPVQAIFMQPANEEALCT
jgi:ferredoxin-type protein NapF